MVLHVHDMWSCCTYASCCTIYALWHRPGAAPPPADPVLSNTSSLHQLLVPAGSSTHDAPSPMPPPQVHSRSKKAQLVTLAQAAALACTARAAVDMLLVVLAASGAVEARLPGLTFLGLLALLRVGFSADLLRRQGGGESLEGWLQTL